MTGMLRMFTLAAVLTVSAAAAAVSPPLLTLDEALRTTLDSSYGIRIAATNAEAAKINNTAGNAGMLPYLSFAASDNYSDNEPPLGNTAPAQYQRQSNTFAAAARLDWTLFDGGRMFIAKARLAHMDSMGTLNHRAAVLQTIADVTTNYYDIVRQKQQLAFIGEVITLNRERVALAQTSFTAGLSPKTPFLQASVDLNVYLEKAISQEGAVRASKRALNLLLCRDPETTFEVIDSISPPAAIDRAALLAAIDTAAIPLRILERQIDIAGLSLRESRALLLPKLSVNAGYGISATNATSGSAGTTAFGPQAGIQLSVPLYQGGNTKRQIAAAQLNLESATIELHQERNRMFSRLSALIDDFEQQERMLAIERENIVLAKENLDIAMQRLRLGQTTILELRQAEESYADSRTRLLSIAFALKAAETTLKLLTARE